MWEDSDTDTRQKGSHEEEERAGRMTSRQWKNGIQEAHQHCRRSSFLSLSAVTHRMQSSEHEAAPLYEWRHHLYEPECGCEKRFRSGWGFSNTAFRAAVIKKKKKNMFLNIILRENAQNFLDLGRPSAQLAGRASHVQQPRV